ncbi:MAG: sigma-70 family RNA polymerase sigma factor [Bacteroidetes bacterium]|nr:sigma-70 family RNA polymerase sigma factor [Bacteroidota bacterium]
MEQQELLPHLFRAEFSKITAVICRHFGFRHIEIAEDIASDTFLAAFETWPYKGVPPNPTAWLYAVAKNKARNHLQRNAIFQNKIANEIINSGINSEEIEINLSEKNSMDSQLQMLFAVCHPSISAESQIALSLRVLCGFGIEEIATALLTNRETVNKRLYRAKEKLREEKVEMEFPGVNALKSRLNTVLTTLYLLFNEGYYSESQESIVRKELCQEAMRLMMLLRENDTTNLPAVNALLALMCFQSSRLKARKNNNDGMILYEDQDDSLWDEGLISQGAFYLHEASQGNELTKYHLEASIAYWHTVKSDTPEKWKNILQLFDQLLRFEYSVVAALNRTYALSKVKGKEAAIREAEKLNLTNNHFYFTLLGELYSGIDTIKAKLNFEKAMELANTNTDKQTIRKKIRNLQV